MEVFYELSKSPPTHDFCNWLSRVSTLGDIQVRIVPGDRDLSPRDKYYGKEKRLWRIQNLLTPLAWLLPSVTDVSLGRGEQKHAYGHPGGPQAPCLRAPEHARKIVKQFLPPKVVTISLRNSDFEPERNTNNAEWELVCDWLSNKGYTPVIIPDAEADMSGRYRDIPYIHYRAASYHPALRVALYELAHHNLFICSGVQLLAMYCDIRLTSFKTHVPGIQCLGKEYMRKAGWSPEHKWPNKQVFWETDTSENVIQVLGRTL